MPTLLPEPSTAAPQRPGIRAWLARHRLAVIIALGCAVSLPALGVGFVLDDVLHRAVLEGRTSEYTYGWFNVYEFTSPSEGASRLIARGSLPWFTDSELRLRFFRPLSSFLLVLDHRLFARSALLAHLHSLVWLAVLLGAFIALMRRWFREPAAALSGLVFALAGVHATPVSWLAARHSVVAAALGVMAIWALSGYRERGFRAGWGLAFALLCLSLLASEIGLAALVFLVLYESWRPGLLKRRLIRSLPWVAVGTVYLLLYAALDYGTRHSGAYTSPFHSPGLFAIALATSLPLWLAELFGGLPAVAATVDERAVSALSVWGLFTFGLSVAVLIALRERLTPDERRHLTWLGVATVCSLIPIGGGIVDGRLLPMSMVGAAALLGNVLSLLWSARGRWLGRSLAFCALGCFATVHLGVSPLVRLLLPFVYSRLSQAQQSLANGADLGRCSQRGRLYLLTGSDPMVSIYGGISIVFHAPEKAGAERFRVLSMAPHDQRLHRTQAHTFELEVLGPERRSNLFEQLFRAPSGPLRVGDRVRAEELEAQVLEVASGLPTRVRFELARETAADACLLVWQSGKLTTIEPPELGESTLIRHAPGPLGL